MYVLSGILKHTDPYAIVWCGTVWNGCVRTPEFPSLLSSSHKKVLIFEILKVFDISNISGYKSFSIDYSGARPTASEN